jgi:hypothetical protein
MEQKQTENNIDLLIKHIEDLTNKHNKLTDAVYALTVAVKVLLTSHNIIGENEFDEEYNRALKIVKETPLMKHEAK